jgi:hypothetical protein
MSGRGSAEIRSPLSSSPVAEALRPGTLLQGRPRDAQTMRHTLKMRIGSLLIKYIFHADTFSDLFCLVQFLFGLK